MTSFNTCEHYSPLWQANKKFWSARIHFFLIKNIVPMLTWNILHFLTKMFYLSFFYLVEIRNLKHYGSNFLKMGQKFKRDLKNSFLFLGDLLRYRLLIKIGCKQLTRASSSKSSISIASSITHKRKSSTTIFRRCARKSMICRTVFLRLKDARYCNVRLGVATAACWSALVPPPEDVSLLLVELPVPDMFPYIWDMMLLMPSEPMLNAPFGGCVCRYKSIWIG